MTAPPINFCVPMSPSNIPSLKTSLPASERAPPPEQASAMAPKTSWPNSTDRRHTDETATCRSSGPIQGTRRVDRQSHAALHAVAQKTHLDALTDAQQRQPVAQLCGALERHAVHGSHHVAHFDARVI